MSLIHPSHYTTLTYNGVSQEFPQKCNCDFYTGNSVRRHLVHDWEEKLHHMRRKRPSNDRYYDDYRSYSLCFSQRMALDKEKYEKAGVKFSSINSPPGPHDSSISKATAFRPGRRTWAIIEDMKIKGQYIQMQKMDWEPTADVNSNTDVMMITPPHSPKSPANGPEKTTKITQVTITPRIWGPLVPLDYKNEWDLIGYGPKDQQTIDKKKFIKENRYGENREIITTPSHIDMKRSAHKPPAESVQTPREWS